MSLFDSISNFGKGAANAVKTAVSSTNETLVDTGKTVADAVNAAVSSANETKEEMDERRQEKWISIFEFDEDSETFGEKVSETIGDVWSYMTDGLSTSTIQTMLGNDKDE